MRIQILGRCPRLDDDAAPLALNRYNDRRSPANAESKNRAASKESVEERRRFIRDAGDLVRCLTIEFEIELRLGAAVVPVGKKFELTPAHASLRERGASDGDAHARRLPGDPGFLCGRFGQRDDAAGDETWPAFVLARENEDRVAFGDVLATIHRLLRAERERLRRRIANLGFDREHHALHLAQLIPWLSMGLGLTGKR